MPMDAFEPTLFEHDHAGEGRGWFPQTEEAAPIEDLLPNEAMRSEPLNFPDVSEPEVVRPLYPPVTPEFLHRQRFLSARFVHHEVQSKGQRILIGPPRFLTSCTRKRAMRSLRGRCAFCLRCSNTSAP